MHLFSLKYVITNGKQIFLGDQMFHPFHPLEMKFPIFVKVKVLIYFAENFFIVRI